MSSTSIQAIDVHVHYGQYRNADNTLIKQFMSAEIDTVTRYASLANTCLSIVSPIEALLLGGDGNVVPMNADASRLAGSNTTIRQWVVVNPLCPPSYRQAAEMLKTPQCIGIKIHPEMHRYRFLDYARELIGFAAEHQAIVQSHCGEDGCMPEDYIAAADEFPEVRIIMAHLGLSDDGDPSHHVRAMQKCKHGNLFADTSSGNSLIANLIEWSVREIGAEKLLYGSDSPLYFAPMQRSRINFADINDDEKRLILRDNAIRLFDLPADLAANT